VVELDANKKTLNQINLVYRKGTNDWTQKQIDFKTGPNTAYLYVYANIWKGYGTFWVDDVKVSLKDAPVPTTIQTPTPTPTPTPTVTPPPTIHLCITKDCILKYKELELLNNMWGSSSDGPTTTQSEFYYDNGIIGWEWSRLSPVECYPGVTCPNYPEVRYTLPNNIAFGDIDAWTSDIEWKYTTVPTGYYDLAFDLWASNNQRSQTEIMINLEGGLSGETFQGTVTDGINQYNYNYFYAGENGGQTDWNYCVFTLANQDPVQSNVKYSKSVNIKALINQIPQSYLDPSWVLPDIHFGNEVWNDAGRIEISKYYTNLNGNIIIN
jgi:hypothetical protein